MIDVVDSVTDSTGVFSQTLADVITADSQTKANAAQAAAIAAATATSVSKTGDTMTGPLNMNYNTIYFGNAYTSNYQLAYDGSFNGTALRGQNGVSLQKSDGSFVARFTDSHSELKGAIALLRGTIEAGSSSVAITNTNGNLVGESIVYANSTTELNKVNLTTTEEWRHPLNIKVVGDSEDRLSIRGSGKLEWGNGTSAPDITLERIVAGSLNCSNNFGVSNELFVNGTCHFANVRLETGDLEVRTAGKGIRIKEGSNARMGIATLVDGTVTISNTSVTDDTRIFYSVKTAGGTQGFLSTTRSGGTSFTINSTSATDTSIVVWELKEPILY